MIFRDLSAFACILTFVLSLNNDIGDFGLFFRIFTVVYVIFAYVLYYIFKAHQKNTKKKDLEIKSYMEINHRI